MADGETRTARSDGRFGHGFLTDIWYFAALSHELKPGKLARHEILGEPVLLAQLDRIRGFGAVAVLDPVARLAHVAVAGVDDEVRLSP